MLLFFKKNRCSFLGVVPKLGCAPTDKKKQQMILASERMVPVEIHSSNGSYFEH
jgi:hypothetical protein